MPKYVDVDEMKKRIKCDDTEMHDYKVLMTFIDHLPAEDVAPIIHARWDGMDSDGDADGNPVYDSFVCSNCGHEHYGDYDSLTPYCPDCGARMDAESEEK